MRSRCPRRPDPRVALLALALALALPAGADAPAAAAQADDGAARLSALVIDPAVSEISGMAASRRRDGLFWVHNDSDNGNAIHALDTAGHVRATVTIDGARNYDWEDIASFERNGKPYLLVADVGDTGGLRKSLNLIVVREPVLGAGGERHVRADWTVAFRWPDGARDCEAVAVDAERMEALLVAKKRVPAQVFRVSLAKPRAGEPMRVAEQVASIAAMPQPTAEDLARDPRFGKYRGQITGMDVDARSGRVALLTYTDGYLFDRRPGDTWQALFARPPRPLHLPPLPQGEAIAFDRRGTELWITSERLPAPLLHLPVPASDTAQSR